MHLHHHTPLPPARNGIADYAARVNDALAGRVALTCVNENPFSVVPQGVEITDPMQIDRQDDPGAIPLYQIGNNGDHAGIFREALRRPGVVVLHDLRLFYLHELMNLPRHTFEAMMRVSNPIMARLRADDVVRKSRKFGTDYSVFDMVWGVLQRSRGIVVHSDYARSVLLRNYGAALADRIAVIPHFAIAPKPTDVAAVRARLGLGEDTRLIVTSGFATKVKRFDWVADAVKALIAAGHDVHWLHAGAEKREEFDLTGLIDADERLARHATITGFLSEEDLDEYISAADVVINLRFPSVGESSGTLARALAAGRCCLVTKTAAYDSYPDNVVVKVPPFDAANGLYAPLEALLRAPEARAAFGANARRYCDSRLSMENYVADLLEVCEAAATRAPLSAVSPFERKADGDILDLGRFPVDALDLGAVERGLPKEFMLRSLQLNAEADGSITVEAIGLDARRRMWQAETDGGRTGA